MRPYPGYLKFRAGLTACVVGLLPIGSVVAAETEAEAVGPYPGTVSWPTDYGMRELSTRVQRAAEANGLSVVGTSTAAVRDGSVPGNLVILVTRNEDAVQILQADTLAGMEMPIRIYLSEQPNHHASVIYRTPSSIFALYDNPKLDALAGKMDMVYAKMVEEAVGGN